MHLMMVGLSRVGDFFVTLIHQDWPWSVFSFDRSQSDADRKYLYRLYIKTVVTVTARWSISSGLHYGPLNCDNGTFDMET